MAFVKHPRTPTPNLYLKGLYIQLKKALVKFDKWLEESDPHLQHSRNVVADTKKKLPFYLIETRKESAYCINLMETEGLFSSLGKLQACEGKCVKLSFRKQIILLIDVSPKPEFKKRGF